MGIIYGIGNEMCCFVITFGKSNSIVQNFISKQIWWLHIDPCQYVAMWHLIVLNSPAAVPFINKAVNSYPIRFINMATETKTAAP